MRAQQQNRNPGLKKGWRRTGRECTAPGWPCPLLGFVIRNLKRAVAEQRDPGDRGCVGCGLLEELRRVARAGDGELLVICENEGSWARLARGRSSAKNSAAEAVLVIDLASLAPSPSPSLSFLSYRVPEATPRQAWPVPGVVPLPEPGNS